MDHSFIQALILAWNKCSLAQRWIIGVALPALVLALVLLAQEANHTEWAALYPADRLGKSEASDIKTYLDDSNVVYKLKGETQILVPQSQVHKVRMELAAQGLPKAHKITDQSVSSTWLRGDRELQEMEMQALKTQLEADISQFENVKSASISLDVAPAKPFGGTLYKTKASVILTLKPGGRLDSTQLRAISFYLEGAVRGLRSNMIAISDTTGKLYQAINPDSDIDLVRGEEEDFEERLKAKVDGMLALIVGADHFYSTVQVTMHREASSDKAAKQAAVQKDDSVGKINTISLGVMIDRNVSNGNDTLKKDIERQLATILDGYHIQAKPAVDFIAFQKVPVLEAIQKPISDKSFEDRVLTVAISVVISFCLMGLFSIFFSLLKKPSK